MSTVGTSFEVYEEEAAFIVRAKKELRLFRIAVVIYGLVSFFYLGLVPNALMAAAAVIYLYMHYLYHTEFLRMDRRISNTLKFMMDYMDRDEHVARINASKPFLDFMKLVSKSK